MSGLILPGDAPRRGGLTILVPRGYESGEREPCGECVLCDVVFFDQDEAQRHFRRNAAKHASLADEARAERIEQRMPVFDEESWDPEYAAHMREVGRRMLAEGRLVTRPNER